MKNLFIVMTAFLLLNQGYAQQITNPSTLFDPAPYGFSHVVSVPANSEFVFIAGQGGEEDTEGKLSNDFRIQVKHALKNIGLALESKDMDMNSVVKVTTLVVDHDQDKLQIIVEEFKKAWPDLNFPANTLIPVPRLALEGMLVEIEALAIKK